MPWPYVTRPLVRRNVAPMWKKETGVRRCDGVGCLWNDVRQPRVNFKLGDVIVVFVGGVGAAVFFQATSLEFLKILCTGLKSVWNVQTKKGCKNPDGSEVHRKMHGCSTGGVEGGSPSRTLEQKQLVGLGSYE